MTAILGYADLLMDPRINASNRNNYSAIIHRSGEHLLTLINDILDLSKIESGKFLLDMKQCNIVSLLADVASPDGGPRAESRGVSFLVDTRTNFPKRCSPMVPGYARPVINLVGNAIKFTERAPGRAGRHDVHANLAAPTNRCADRGDRHGNRHSPGSASRSVSTVHQVGFQGCATLRRHGTRIGHLAAHHPNAWRRFEPDQRLGARPAPSSLRSRPAT